MNPQYEILAKCLLPTHMLEWFELTNVEVKSKEKKSAQDQQFCLEALQEIRIGHRREVMTEVAR